VLNVQHQVIIMQQLLVTGLLLTSICPTAWAEGLTLYIAPNGNDAWSGRLAEPKGGDGPFLTLQRARDEIRKLKKEAGPLPRGVVVELSARV
jgi:hypothetical protein